MAPTTPRGLRAVKTAMLVTDVAFLLYWSVALLNLIPPEHAYKDYRDPVMSDWNYSFLPLDVAASVTGLASLYLAGSRRQRIGGRHDLHLPLMLVSLALTSAAGLQAVSFWALRGDWSLAWWIPNFLLFAFPVPAIVYVLRGPSAQSTPTHDSAATAGRM
ncbi:DUF5360 family protein [Streptomyces sp. NPDC048057]|uniref:DUF5360 family protein n=1 Tax=Streptomyces sp. NPDC048057 TaxID=3155628 RepID=UPI00340206A8